MRLLVVGSMLAAALVVGSGDARADGFKCGSTFNCTDIGLAALRTQIDVRCPCATQSSQKTYKKCYKQVIKESSLNKQCKKAATMGAKFSTCGRPGAVVCDKKNKKGTKITCTIQKSADKCKGSACGAFVSCADACPDNTSGGVCAPPPTTTTTTVTPVTTTTTTLPGAACQCANIHTLAFTTTLGTGNCGTVVNNTGSVLVNLACGGLYTGSGSDTVPLPYPVPDMGRTITAVSACDQAGQMLTLGPVADPGGTSITDASHRTCSSVGCLFGAPLPIPNPSSTPTSVCVINSVAQDAAGTYDCSTGAGHINLPLTSALFLTGDAEPGTPGLQPCPTCLNNTCSSGPNSGMPCTPGDSPATSSFPTSHDCPPDPMNAIGSIPIAFDLTTDTQTKTAVDPPASPRSFCAYCRDADAGGALSAQGWGKCQGGANMGLVCRSSADCPSSVCGAPIPCTSDAQCEPSSDAESRESCQQNGSGAFAKAAGRTITETGSPGLGLGDGGTHPMTLVSIFCIPPTFNSTVDAAAGLPGPGSVALEGEAQLLP